MIHRIMTMLRIGRVSLVDDSGPIRRIQIDEGDFLGGRRVIDKVAHIQEFGFASVPPIGADVLLGAPGGDRSQTIAMGTNHQPSRPRNQQPGDSGIYDSRGAFVRLSAAGTVIDAAGLDVTIRNAANVTVQAATKITLDAPLVECTGNFKADKLLTGDGIPVELGALRDAYNAHHHTGVAAGGATSGGTDHPV